jgi:hypothetical protein
MRLPALVYGNAQPEVQLLLPAVQFSFLRGRQLSAHCDRISHTVG